MPSFKSNLASLWIISAFGFSSVKFTKKKGKREKCLIYSMDASSREGGDIKTRFAFSKTELMEILGNITYSLVIIL